MQSPDQTGELQCDNLQQEQANDSELVKLVHYVSEGVVPEDQKLVKRFSLEVAQHDLINSVLHHENPVSGGLWYQSICERV
jgi:hypothetical protein